tara:strand:- start:19519 stop:20388 length:870 start_codon:yes stop_codon:yes gene_type:complete
MANRINGDEYPSSPTDWKQEKITSIDDALAFIGWSIMDQNNIMDPTEGFISEADGKPAHRIIITPMDMISDMAGLTDHHEYMKLAAWKEELPEGEGIALYHYTQEVAEQLQECFAKAFEVARLNGHDLFEAIFQMQTFFLIYQADPETFNFGHIPCSMNQVEALIDGSETEEEEANRRKNVMRQVVVQILHQLGAAVHNPQSGETALIPHLVPEPLQDMVQELFGDIVCEQQAMVAPANADKDTVRNMVADELAKRVEEPDFDDGSQFTDADIDSYDDDPFGAELWEEE